MNRCVIQSAMAQTPELDTEFDRLLSRLPADLDLDVSARDSGALVRRRGVKNAASLLRLAFGYGVCGLSLRAASAWAEVGDIARVSDVALLNRLRRSADWLGGIVAAILSERMADAVSSGERSATCWTESCWVAWWTLFRC